MSRTFQGVLQGSQAIKSGHYEHQMPTDTPFLEARHVAEDFNVMAHQLSDVQGRLTEQNQQLQQLNQEVLHLSHLSDQLQTCLNLTEAREVLAMLLPDFLPGTSGEVMVFNASRNQLAPFAEWGMHTTETLPIAPSGCLALRVGHTYEMDGKKNVLACPYRGQEEAYLCTPMLAQGETVGIFRVHAADLTPQERELVGTLARQLALAIANLQLWEALRNQSIRDALTGLHNRRFFEEAYQRELDHTERHQRPLSILMLDVDHFKHYNDIYGHDAGNTVLKQFGQMLTRACRASDLVCRYGGEEFVVLLPETDLQTALRVAERIRSTTETLQMVTPGGLKLPPITVSIGVSCTTEHGHGGDELLALADQALYAAKHAGRNRVEAAPG